MGTISLNGHPTWAKVSKGKGPTLVLLHGGMSSSESLLSTIGPGLAKRYRLAAFDRRGHGRTADTPSAFHYDLMAAETIAFLEHLGTRAHLVGHSDGAIVALLVAMRRPDLVRRVVAVGANYHYEGLRPNEVLNAESTDFDRWAQWYAKRSPDGVAHARVVVEKTLRLFASEPTLTPADLGEITVPVLVMSGDDEPIYLSHTCSLYESIPGSELCVVPGTSHSVLEERPGTCVRIIRDFLESTWPPVTAEPIRRRSADR
ncbi:MAG: alpha/beta hydrolase [Acidimicrobiales bacterium]|jgi:pimeloyl-ACP methyl ester carboxylesterase